MAGIPDKVKKAAEEAERLATSGSTPEVVVSLEINPDGQELPVQDPVPSDETPSSAEQPPDGTNELQSRFDELTKLYDTERQRNVTLRSKYDAEVPALYAQMRDLKEKLKDLEQRKAAEPQKPEGPAYRRHLKDAEVQDLDKSVLDLQARLSRGVAEEEVEKLAKEIRADMAAIKRDRERDQSLRSRDMADRIWLDVEKVHPGAKTMDETDPAWGKFLDTVDPLSGVSYAEIGKKALDEGNADRLIRLIDTYQTGAGSVMDSRGGGIKPRSVRVSESPSQSNGKGKIRIKESEIKRFVDDYTKGLYKGRTEEAKKKQADIDSAVADGHVDFGS